MLPFPRTAFPRQISKGYQPAPLDLVSFHNGVFKFTTRPEVVVDESLVEYLLFCLSKMFPILPYDQSTDEEVRALVDDVRDSSAGFPMNELGCPTKGQVLEKFSLLEIRNIYDEYESVIGSTLKDELRLIGKDARLFRPADMCAYVEGAYLFHHQNSYLISKKFTSPLFIKFKTPGIDLTVLRTLLRNFSGNCYGFDGDQWDTKFPRICIEAIARFRALQGSFDFKERVHKYYSRMYYGYTNVLGNLCEIDGNPSGHFNTTVDNSLANVCLMLLHAREHGISYTDFRKLVLCYFCGDDAIYSDKTGKFTPELLTQTYNKYGTFVSFEYLTPSDPDKLTFVGTLGVKGGYHYGINKLLAAFKINKTNVSCDDILAKRVSICILLYYTPHFTTLKEKIISYVEENKLLLDDNKVDSLLALLNPYILERCYKSFESFFFSSGLSHTSELLNKLAGLKFSLSGQDLWQA